MKQLKRKKRSPSSERPATPALQLVLAQKRRTSYLGVPSLSGTSSVSPTESFSTPPTPGHFNPAKSPRQYDEVCFGTIKDVKVLLKWESNSAEIQKIQEELGDADSDFRVLHLDFQQEHCLVQIESGDAVGVLEDRALKVLTQLIKNEPFTRFEVVVSASQWEDDMASLLSRGRQGQQINVDVDVFGPEDIAMNVALILGRGRLFLQSPSRQLLPPYKNPQCIQMALDPSLEKCISHVASQKPGTVVSESHEELETYKEAMEIHEQEDNLHFIDVMDTIVYDFEKSTDVDCRVLTPLHSYQREAVQFIKKRESCNDPKTHSLWDPLGDEQHAIGYQHAITGAKSRTADDAPGGILADAMGLGKTLTMIATIAGSLDKASKLTRENDIEANTKCSESRSKWHYTKATLVVVPSELLIASWTEEIQT
jgi:SWI/SNF-related matrix-associated actin-dependent regulator of chromatin subfamily A3